MSSKLDVVLGLQWGDEGKGKIVDVLAGRYPAVARFQGGPNAGHSLHFDGKNFVVRSIPSGIFREGSTNIIGSGVVLDPITLREECANVEKMNINPKEKLFISKKANLILPTHRLLDAAYEAAAGKGKIGSTLKGIGPTYTDKISRHGLRVGDILAPDFRERFEKLKARHIQLLSDLHFECDPDKDEAEWMSAIEFLKGFNLIDCEYFVNKWLGEKPSSGIDARHRLRFLPVRDIILNHGRRSLHRIGSRPIKDRACLWNIQGLLHACGQRSVPNRAFR